MGRSSNTTEGRCSIVPDGMGGMKWVFELYHDCVSASDWCREQFRISYLGEWSTYQCHRVDPSDNYLIKHGRSFVFTKEEDAALFKMSFDDV